MYEVIKPMFNFDRCVYTNHKLIIVVEIFIQPDYYLNVSGHCDVSSNLHIFMWDFIFTYN